MRVIQVGSQAALVEVEDPVAASLLAQWARATGVMADEIVPAARTVLFDAVDVADLRRRLQSWTTPQAAAGDGSLVTVPVHYDGADLSWVAHQWGCSTDEVVARHTAIEFRSVFCGFAPGFAYLAGLPTHWAVPRRDSPRERVPTGSVGLADDLCGVYPAASPGGWRLLGRTTARLWDPDADQPALLAPGTRVRFEVLR